jgi:hypothetical protein
LLQVRRLGRQAVDRKTGFNQLVAMNIRQATNALTEWEPGSADFGHPRTFDKSRKIADLSRD